MDGNAEQVSPGAEGLCPGRARRPPGPRPARVVPEHQDQTTERLTRGTALRRFFQRGGLVELVVERLQADAQLLGGLGVVAAVPGPGGPQPQIWRAHDWT